MFFAVSPPATTRVNGLTFSSTCSCFSAQLPSSRHQMAMVKAAKSEAICMALLVQNREPSSFSATAPAAIKGEY